MPAGRPTELTKEMLRKIKQGVLDGLNLKEIAKSGGITEELIYHWNSINYKGSGEVGLGDLLDGWRRDRKLLLAERKLKDILEFSVSDKETLKVQADISKFIAETLGKKNYSKRSEVTGADGKDLIPTKEDQDKIKQLLDE